MNLDLLALDLTNDPNPVRFDGVPPEYKPEKVMVASLYDLTGLLVQIVVSQIPGETIYYYINDHLGTPQKIVDENSAVVWSADYKPFGEADVTVTTAQNNFRFPGQYYDSATGLHYNWHRYYDPALGRYLTPDPLSIMAEVSDLYSYTKNNPLNFKDEFGLYRKECNECEELKFHTSYFIACMVKPGAIIGATEVLACLACVGKVALPIPEWVSCTVCIAATAAQIGAILDCVDKARWCEPKK